MRVDKSPHQSAFQSVFMLQCVTKWGNFIHLMTLGIEQQNSVLTSTQQTKTQASQSGEVLHAESVKTAVNVFEYTDYRSFLKDFYETKKNLNPQYSMSSFTRRAGLGESSRGYLKLIIEGKRNLTTHTLRRFSEALGLAAKDALYFENLVYFNQAKTGKDRDFYFQRMAISASGQESKQFELLRSQYQYHSNWYYVAVREIAGLASFKEEPSWISNQLRGKISSKQAQEALTHLERLGLLRRHSGKLIQSEPLVKYTGGQFNNIIQKFHGEMIDRAKESLVEDSYEERNASCVTLSCDHARLAELKKRIDQFRDQVTTEFGVGSKSPDAVIQVNVQLFQLTPPRKHKAFNPNPTGSSS